MGRTSEWHWSLTPNHWIDLKLSRTGLVYTGTNWDCHSSGGYMAGSQTSREFVADGPMNDMPPEIAEAVRAAVVGKAGHHVVVRIAGEVPDEIHLEFHGQSQMKRGTAVVFDGDLLPEAYATSGVLLYSGADARGRRRMKTFAETIEVTGPMDVEISDLAPRFKS
jgi:hypothetical protein